MLTEHNYTSWPGLTRPSKLLDCQREAAYLDGRVKPGHDNTRLISLGLIMGISHKTRPLHGVQFHPESIASEQGSLILRNFLDLAMDWNAKSGRA